MELSYDGAGRLDSVSISRGALGYTYAQATGKLATISAPGGIGMTYTYDGSLLTGTAWSGPMAGSVGFTYDNDFNVAEVASIPAQPNPNGPFVQLELIGANYPKLYVVPLP